MINLVNATKKYKTLLLNQHVAKLSIAVPLHKLHTIMQV